MNIAASRVTLRGFTVDDLPGFLEWATDDAVTERLLWNSYTCEDDALIFLRNVAIPHPWLKAICVDGRAVGSIVLERGTGFDVHTGVLGYCIARRFWGMGVTTHAVREIVRLGFRDTDIARIEALVMHDNAASRRVLEKAGFAHEGTMYKYKLVKGKLRDYYLFATYAPEDPSNSPSSS